MVESLPAAPTSDRLLTLYEAESYVEAEALAREILNAEPAHLRAWQILGAILQKTDRLDEALIVKRQAIEHIPDNAGLHYNLGNALVLPAVNFRRNLVSRNGGANWRRVVVR